MLREKRPLVQIRWEDRKIKVLICDDDPVIVHQISQMIQVHCATNGISATTDELTDPNKIDIQKAYDIAFLDIDMPQTNGIKLALKLRSTQKKPIIIFVTNFIQYAPDGYEVGAFRYLMKEKIPDKLPLYFDLAINEIVKRRRIVTIQINGERIDIPVVNIRYLESSGRIITIHLFNDLRSEYRFYGNMTDLSQKFEILGFLRVHKSYLVNMRYIKIFQCKRLELNDGFLIPISERKYSQLKQSYLEWESENKWNI